MQHVKFYKNEHEQGVELTYKPNTYKNVIHYDYLTELTKERLGIRYPLNEEEYKLYQNHSVQIDRILTAHNLKGKKESEYHHSSLLFIVIEFYRQFKNSINWKAGEARIDNMIKFLKLVRPLTSFQKQSVGMTFTIKSVPFTFEDFPFLSEEIINKISGDFTNKIRHSDPELWKSHFKSDGKPRDSKKTVADSKLQNQAVAEITKMLISYLNVESAQLKNPKASPDKFTLTSKQGSFIYDLLVELEIYEPREKAKAETNRKEANYHGLRKLIERY